MGTKLKNLFVHTTYPTFKIIYLYINQAHV